MNKQEEQQPILTNNLLTTELNSVEVTLSLWVP